MKKYKWFFAIICIITLSLLIFHNDIFSILTSSDKRINYIKLCNKTGYIVIHETMNLDGETYSEYSTETFDDVLLGTTVNPEVLELNGFKSPEQQTVVLDSYEKKVIRYQYERKKYDLTINGSNYVTTSTPTGSYYYGTEINLVADSVDERGNRFVKWSNNETNINYTFTLTDDVSITPIYEQSYIVTFEPNNGEHSTVTSIHEGESIPEFPTLVRESCEGTQGNYFERNCSEVYEISGWYLEPDFQTKVDENYVPTSDITLYAKWNKNSDGSGVNYKQNQVIKNLTTVENDILDLYAVWYPLEYNYEGEYEFDGTNYINTGVYLFSDQTKDKDFDISFEIVNRISTGNQATIMSAMDETGSPWPGVVYRIKSSSFDEVSANVNGSNKIEKDYSANGINKVLLKKRNGILYVSFNDGEDEQLLDMTSLNKDFDVPLTFGCSLRGNGTPQRYFKGTLKNMHVKIYP